MKTKIIENYLYEGLGFSIILPSIKMVYFQKEWHPKIDVQKVADKAIKLLITQPARLTGDQIKFIRTYFSMTLREFAKEVVHESHTAVDKWEKFRDKVTNMDGNIEAMLRLYIYERLFTKTEKQQNDFYKKYQAIKKLFLTERKNTEPLLLLG